MDVADRASAGGGDGAPVAAVLFDIDGTLISTGGAAEEAWRRAFEQLHEVEVEVSEYSTGGMTDPEVGRLSFRGALGRDPSHRELARLLGLELRLLPDAVADSDGYTVMPGVEELLERLIDGGHLLGLTTGNVEAAAHIKLARANLNRFFSFGGYGSDATDRAELTRRAIERARAISGGVIAAADCVSVGDTPLDVEAGHGAEIRVVGVATGRFGTDELRGAGADFAIDSLRDWPSVLEVAVR
ncbi:MAG TPA: HAD family hydrolase [Solirubrobacterales bacterium]|nr:HAD family hydrolase [Solirubrobacterales bacterium]